MASQRRLQRLERTEQRTVGTGAYHQYIDIAFCALGSLCHGTEDVRPFDLPLERHQRVAQDCRSTEKFPGNGAKVLVDRMFRIGDEQSMSADPLLVQQPGRRELPQLAMNRARAARRAPKKLRVRQSIRCGP